MDPSVREGKGVADESARGSNQSGMRAYNERLVLSLIRRSGAMAKAEIARKTGLSAQTVSVIMRSLEADGLLTKGDPVRGKVGQPSVPMGLAREGAFFLGLKIGRRSLDLVLTDFTGTVVDRARRQHPFPTPDGAVQFANETIPRLVGRLPADQQSRVAGLGIALPFQLWGWAEPLGIDPAAIADWRHRDIAREIEDRWNLPVFLCNDASAACGAELVFGDQGAPRDFLYFFVGFFAGGGLVLDGTLFSGRSGNAAALGSMPVIAAEGGSRQLVDVASLAALESALVAHGEDGSVIWDRAEDWNLPDEIVTDWVENAASGLAWATLSSVCLIDVECVVIDGWIPQEVRAALVRRTIQRIDDISLAGVVSPDVREGTIGSDARSLGAASLPLSERFLVDRTAFLKG